jgi:hypothetical protein
VIEGALKPCDKTSEARVRGKALADLLPERALSPNNCFEDLTKAEE